MTPSDLRYQKNFVKEVDFEQWLDAGGGFQDTQSREGQREQHEQRLRVVGGWMECSGSSGHAGRIGLGGCRGRKEWMRRERWVGPDCEDLDTGVRPSIAKPASVATHFILRVALCVILPL